MNLLIVISCVTVGLTVILMMLMVFIMVLRIFSDRRAAREGLLRSKMAPVLQQYLAGTSDMAAVLDELKQDREMALESLVEAASPLPSRERSRLQVFFAHFQFERMLMDEVRSTNLGISVRAAARLGYAGTGECVPVLLEALNHRMLDVRLAAARSLAQLGAGDAVEPILRSLALPGKLPQQTTAEILFEMGQVAIDPLLTFLRANSRKEPGPALPVTVRVLGLLKADKAAPEIAELLSHPYSEVRLNSARALGIIGARGAVDQLCQLAVDPVWEVRSSTVQALGHIQDASAVPVIARALGDQGWWVRFNAAQALHELGGAGIEALKKTMSDSRDAFARDISRQILQEHGVIAAEGGTRP